MRKKQQQQKTQNQKQQFTKQINAQTLRNSFLEQAAYLLNSTSVQEQNNKNTTTETKDSYNLLARLALREVRELCFGDQIRMHKDFKRNYCKKCFNCWMAPESEKNNFSVKIKKISKQKTIVLKCQSCQITKTIPFNVNYKSRNEKANS
ncbi:hypothetical protein ACQ4LE_008763 [Meloidogyne hapla]